MSGKIGELLAEKAREMKELGEVTESICSGKEVSEEQQGTGDFPSLGLKDINGLKTMYFSECKNTVDPDLIKNHRTFRTNDILMLSSSWRREMVGKSFLYLGEKECIGGVGIFIIRAKQNPRYLVYALNSEQSRRQIEGSLDKKHIKGLPTSLGINKLKKIKIPMVDEDTQRAIADYLDEFYEGHLELEKELERELEEREIQYEEYKNLLFEEGINKFNWEIRRVGEVSGGIHRGCEIKEEHLGSGDHPAIRPKDLVENRSPFFEECVSFVDPGPMKFKRYCEWGDLLVMENKRSCVYLGKEKCLVGYGITAVKHSLNPKYMEYLWSSEFVGRQIDKRIQPPRDPSLRKEDIEAIEIPVPPAEEQERIAKKLDEYHSLMEELRKNVQRLKEDNGLQYGEYRDLIFSGAVD